MEGYSLVVPKDMQIAPTISICSDISYSKESYLGKLGKAHGYRDR